MQTQQQQVQEERKVIYIRSERNSDGYVPFNSPYELSLYMQRLVLDSKMSYKDLAKKANVCTQTVSNLASHTTRDPRVNTCIKILRVFDKKFYVK